jgi:hypothetical protein
MKWLGSAMSTGFVYGIMNTPPKRKTYKRRVLSNGKVKLLVEENFK